MSTTQEHLADTWLDFDPNEVHDLTCVSLMLEVSPEVNDFLERVAAETDSTKADVIRRAFGLLKMADRAVKRGLTVGAVDADGNLEIEFVGF